MKSTSKGIIGATLVMAVSIAILLVLVLVLLIELYCSLLPHRRRLRNTTPNATFDTNSSLPTQTQEQEASPLSSFYAQGVLDAPRSLLFPAVSSNENKVEMKNQSCELQRSPLDIHTQEPNTSHCLGIISPSSPSTSFITSPQPIQETSTQVGSNSADKDKACGGGGGIGGEHFVYNSNPIIYDNDASRLSRADTPFETPDTSPSRLESCDEDEIAQPSVPSSPHSVPNTPP